MALLPIHRFFVVNGDLRQSSSFELSENEGGIYEVLRVNSGIPLFLKEHFVRFFNSAKIAGITIRFSEPQIEKYLYELIEKNEVTEGNILISCNTNLNACFIPHVYPNEELFKTGIVCGILKAVRKNPNAKIFKTSVREQADQMMVENGYYEVLLVDDANRITEGSRSNVFFVRENEIVTPPGNEVLLGITRQKTIYLAEKLRFAVKEKDVYPEDLQSFNAAFITGTSPKILPIKQIEGVAFNPVNETIQDLIRSYEDLILEYVNVRREQG